MKPSKRRSHTILNSTNIQNSNSILRKQPVYRYLFQALVQVMLLLELAFIESLSSFWIAQLET